jgi:hypothetical protein
MRLSSNPLSSRYPSQNIGSFFLVSLCAQLIACWTFLRYRGPVSQDVVFGSYPVAELVDSDGLPASQGLVLSHANMPVRALHTLSLQQLRRLTGANKFQTPVCIDSNNRW